MDTTPPNQLSELLQRIGLSDKEAQIYLTLLQLGGAPIRTLAEASSVNRGTTFAALKSLRSRGLVTYYHKAAHQHFVAEPPEKLLDLIDETATALQGVRAVTADALPLFQTLAEGSAKPVVKFYEGSKGFATVLRDVLATVGKTSDKEYLVYSSAHIRQYLYESYPAYTQDRINANIHVKVIAIGSGGELHGLDERKWLPGEQHAPTYSMLYGSKVALLSVNASGQPIGVVMEDTAIAQTQRLLFLALWNTLPDHEFFSGTRCSSADCRCYRR